jgi:hypothetical protein
MLGSLNNRIAVAKKSKLDKIPRIKPILGNTVGSSSDDDSSTITASSSLTQIPSEKTDFPGDDSSPVEVNVISEKKVLCCYSKNFASFIAC